MPIPKNLPPFRSLSEAAQKVLRGSRDADTKIGYCAICKHGAYLKRINWLNAERTLQDGFRCDSCNMDVDRVKKSHNKHVTTESKVATKVTFHEAKENFLKFWVFLYRVFHERDFVEGKVMIQHDTSLFHSMVGNFLLHFIIQSPNFYSFFLILQSRTDSYSDVPIRLLNTVLRPVHIDPQFATINNHMEKNEMTEKAKEFVEAVAKRDDTKLENFGLKCSQIDVDDWIPVGFTFEQSTTAVCVEHK